MYVTVTAVAAGQVKPTALCLCFKTKTDYYGSHKRSLILVWGVFEWYYLGFPPKYAITLGVQLEC
jgi:hypothetical protein